MRSGIMGILMGVTTALSLKNGERPTTVASSLSILTEVLTIISISLLTQF